LKLGTKNIEIGQRKMIELELSKKDIYSQSKEILGQEIYSSFSPYIVKLSHLYAFQVQTKI
jgi:hypothetical protein